MRGSDTEIFEGKNLSQLMRDIYDISTSRRKEILDLSKQLSYMINDPTDAVNIAPIVKDLLDVSVKNDDQLVKLATIVQRIITAEAKSGDISDPSEMISEEEKERLLKNAREDALSLIKNVPDSKRNVLDNELRGVKEKVKKLSSNV